MKSTCIRGTYVSTKDSVTDLGRHSGCRRKFPLPTGMEQYPSQRASGPLDDAGGSISEGQIYPYEMRVVLK